MTVHGIELSPRYDFKKQFFKHPSGSQVCFKTYFICNYLQIRSGKKDEPLRSHLRFEIQPESGIRGAIATTMNRKKKTILEHLALQKSPS